MSKTADSGIEHQQAALRYKRYIVFAHADTANFGGMFDSVGDFDSLSEADDFMLGITKDDSAKELRNTYVFDRLSGVIVGGGKAQSYISSSHGRIQKWKLCQQ